MTLRQHSSSMLLRQYLIDILHQARCPHSIGMSWLRYWSGLSGSCDWFVRYQTAVVRNAPAAAHDCPFRSSVPVVCAEPHRASVDRHRASARCPDGR